MRKQIVRKSNKLELFEFCPAKLNLSLEVLGKRPDGYHDIRSLMIPVDFGDDVRIKVIEGGDIIECYCDNPEVPGGEDNLASKAARVFIARTGAKIGLKIAITKRIPIAGGLAGGSSDAAGVLRALNKLLSYPLNAAQLAEIALKVGSDVPFLLEGKPAWVEGRGERLKPAVVPSHWVYLILHPGFGVSTEWAYNNLALTTANLEHNICYPRLEGIRMVNHLEIPVFHKYPQLRELKKKLMAGGAMGALMSGSGPVIFGVFEDIGAAERVGRETAEKEKIGAYTAKVISNE
jgi:4-diphosphocytidyl-2-C-methyl-D-erythritol kinase